MRRTFIAIPVPPADDRLLTFLVRCRSAFPSSRIRWVDPSILHLTLAFIGETTEADIPRVKIMMQQLASRHSPFMFTITGTGFFGNAGKPSVLWAGISSGSELALLQSDIVKELQSIGIRQDSKPFSPHLTIGRIKDYKPGPLPDKFMNSYSSVELQETDVREIIYYESVLTPGGPVYKAIGRFQLVGH
ncbi:MAG: RNA 2',3'-cyclic phosphodiesterase [Bacteroidales bacterium]